MRLIILIFAGFILFWNATSCSDKSAYQDVTDVLTDYEEIDVVDFSIAGTAVCDWCTKKEINVIGLQLEVVPDDDVTKTLALKVYGKLGPFSFNDLRYRSDATLTIYGRLYYGESDSFVDSSVKVPVPDEDGEAVSCVLNFSESSP